MRVTVTALLPLSLTVDVMLKTFKLICPPLDVNSAPVWKIRGAEIGTLPITLSTE